MPLSRVDLPKVVEALRDLYRVIEDPTPRGRALELLNWDGDRTTAGRMPNPEKAAPSAVIQAAIEYFLYVVMPSGVHTGEACPDITNSELDLSHKVALTQIRRAVTTWPASHSLAKHCEDALEFLDVLGQAIEKLTSKGVPAKESLGVVAVGKTKGKNIDARMLKVMAENVESHGWSARQWAVHLDCSDGTVKGTNTWKVRLKAARATAAADATRKMDRTGTHANGRRKLKHKSNE